jgi:hypothetical protein
MQILAVLLPMIIFLGIYMKRGNAYDLHHATLGRLSLWQFIQMFRLVLDSRF